MVGDERMVVNWCHLRSYGWEASAWYAEVAPAGPFCLLRLESRFGQWWHGAKLVYGRVEPGEGWSDEPLTQSELDSAGSPVLTLAPGLSRPDREAGLRGRLLLATDALGRLPINEARYMEALGEMGRDLKALQALTGRCAVACAWPGVADGG